MPRIAVIGANGRAARVLVDRLVQRGDTVFAGVRQPERYSHPATKNKPVPFLADVASEATIQLPPTLDAIVFAASASAGWTLSNQSPKNVDFNGVKRVAEAADSSTHIVLITSKGVAKRGFYAPRILLNLLWGRVCHWKLQGERALRAHHAGTATIVRPGYLERDVFGSDTQTVYGQGDTFGVGAISRAQLAEVVVHVLNVQTNATFEVIRRVPKAGDCTTLSALKPYRQTIA